MIKELIFILIIVVILLAFVARGPRSILRSSETFNYSRGDTSLNETSLNEQSVIKEVDKRQEPRTIVSTSKKRTTSRVRFSPEKKERVYNKKTGDIIGEHIIPVAQVEE